MFTGVLCATTLQFDESTEQFDVHLYCCFYLKFDMVTSYSSRVISVVMHEVIQYLCIMMQDA